MLQAYYCKVGYEEGNENKEKDRSVQLSARDAAFLNKLAKIMEEQLGNPELNVDQLVSYFSLSRTNFFHKLKSLTGMAPIMYIKEIRMRKAAELIKENQYTMAEIAYMVGFSDPHYFSKSFKSYWGMTSTEYAKIRLDDEDNDSKLCFIIISGELIVHRYNKGDLIFSPYFH